MPSPQGIDCGRQQETLFSAGNCSKLSGFHGECRCGRPVWRAGLECRAAENSRRGIGKGELEDAVRLLRRPDAGNYLNRTYAARGKIVAELVQHMAKLNLRFASALEGDARAYHVLHQSLAKCDVAAQEQLVARK
jgi:hypothetical protein